MNEDMAQDQTRLRGRAAVAIGVVTGMLLGGLIDSYTGDTGIATIAGMFLGFFAGSRVSGEPVMMEYPPAVRRQLVVSGGLFMVVLLLVIRFLSREIGETYTTLLALAPLLPAVWFVISLGKAIGSLDELQRRIQMEAIAIGFGLTGLTVLAIGLLGVAGTSQPGWLALLFVMAASWLAGKIWTMWRYR